MYELWHVGAAYVVGTVVGIGIFRHMVREDLVARAIDTLVDQDYVRTYVDDNGITHLHKWYDLEDLLDGAKVRVRMDEEELPETDLDIIENMDKEEIVEILEELEDRIREKDDTP